MTESLLSVGIDLGTSTTQMIVSCLSMQNTAAPFTVPHMEITDRQIIYRSKVHLTPLLSTDTLDAAGIEAIIRNEYENAGIRPEQVKTGAVIITGETARKENARQVLNALSGLAGEFVVATAGPALESVLASRGAGADRYASSVHRHVLHMDIGGGTANMALFGPEGELLDTGCLNVGGRLIKYRDDGSIYYVSPVLENQISLKIGDTATSENLKPVVNLMVNALEEAVGYQPPGASLQHFITDKTVKLPNGDVTLSFSGGVADLIQRQEPWNRYGDLGVLFGQAIRNSRLCQGAYVLGAETIRATVVGAGSYATELSGSTVFYTGISFPMQNLPVVSLSAEETSADNLAEILRKKVQIFDEKEPTAIFFPGTDCSYEELGRLADAICRGTSSMQRNDLPIIVITRQDMAKALGHALAVRLPEHRKLVCLDGLQIPEGSYLDIAEPVGGGAALPVVIKTLAFENHHRRGVI